jgi:virginiamycin B lyase
VAGKACDFGDICTLTGQIDCNSGVCAPVSTIADGTTCSPSNICVSGRCVPQFTLTPTARVISAQGNPFSTTFATVSDALPGSAGDLTVTLDWGDGTSSAGTLTAVPMTPFSYGISGTHAFAPGLSLVTVTVVSAKTGLVASTTLQVTLGLQLVSFFTPTTGITKGPDGAIWLASAGGIARVGVPGYETNVFVTSEPLQPAESIAVGADGNLWFGGQFVGIGQITLGGTYSFFGTRLAAFPFVTKGDDGNVWFFNGSQIGNITPDGNFTEFVVPAPGLTPAGLTLGSDGNLWFTAASTSTSSFVLGSVTPDGTFTTFDTTASGAITTGPDGLLWACAKDTAIVQLSLTGMALATFPIPAGNRVIGEPESITFGPDGALWIGGPNYVYRMTTAGDFTYFALQGIDVQGLTTGPDGNVWFSNAMTDTKASDNIGWIAP